MLSLDQGPAERDVESGAQSPGLPTLELVSHSLDWDFWLLSLLRTCSVRFPGTLVCKKRGLGKMGLRGADVQTITLWHWWIPGATPRTMGKPTASVPSIH